MMPPEMWSAFLNAPDPPGGSGDAGGAEPASEAAVTSSGAPDRDKESTGLSLLPVGPGPVAALGGGSSYELHDGLGLDVDQAQAVKKLAKERDRLTQRCLRLEAQRLPGGQSNAHKQSILILTNNIQNIDHKIALLNQGADPGSIGNDAANSSMPDDQVVAAAADEARYTAPAAYETLLLVPLLVPLPPLGTVLADV